MSDPAGPPRKPDPPAPPLNDRGEVPPASRRPEASGTPTPALIPTSVATAVLPIPESPHKKHSPLLRNGVHFGAFAVCALPLGFVADPRNARFAGPYGAQIVMGFMLFITAFNIFFLPKLESGRRIARPGEGFVTGQWLYPLALAICFAIFPPFAAFAAWAALAAGDAAASIFGRRIPRPKLPWNKSKSWAGFAAFIGAALPVCCFALWWVPSQQFLKANGGAELPFVWTLAVIASVSGAVLESLNGPGDDNLRVPLGVATILWLTAMFLSYGTRTLPATTHVQPEQFLNAVLLNVGLGAVVLALRFADIPGTLLGVTIGAIVFFFTVWPGYLLFLLFVGLGSLLSRVGRTQKEKIGAAEARGGKRGIANVAANLTVPASCCLLYPAFNGHPALLLAFAGALAAAFADTASSEIGALATERPKLITTWRVVSHGTNGAVTLLGFAAAAGAALLIALTAWLSGFFALFASSGVKLSPLQSVLACLIIVFAGLAGTTVDSILGATVEDRYDGIGKGAVNVACTLAGALVASGLFWLIA